MTRVKSLASIRHRKVKKLAKGYKNARSRRIKTAKEAILHAGQYSYIGRKLRKRDLRKLWITRIASQVKKEDLNYSGFISLLKGKKIEINRKMLSELAVQDPEAFNKIVSEVK